MVSVTEVTKNYRRELQLPRAHLEDGNGCPLSGKAAEDSSSRIVALGLIYCSTYELVFCTFKSPSHVGSCDKIVFGPFNDGRIIGPTRIDLHHSDCL